MGYYIQQRTTQFCIKAKNQTKALVAVKGLVGQEPIGAHFSWVGNFSDADSFQEVMEEWRWEVEFNERGDVIDLFFNGQKLGDDELLFQTIAPFVEAGSYIEILGEEGEMWRWAFDDKECTELSPTIIWTKGEINENRNKSKKDGRKS